jgi:hypothetical protein
MTSQLNVDTIVDKAGSGGTNVKIGNTSTYVSDGGGVTQDTVDSLVKARFRASDAAVLTGSFNFSSGTDNGTGDYTYTFTNNMNNVFYSPSGICVSDDRNCQFSRSRATTDYRVRHYGHDDAFADVDNAGMIAGDLA